MSARQSTAPNQVQRFWDKYLKRLHQDGIKHPFDQWYVKRAEAFLHSSPRRLSERSPGDVEAFFRSFERKPALKGWQFRQIVDDNDLHPCAQSWRKRRTESAGCACVKNVVAACSTAARHGERSEGA